LRRCLVAVAVLAVNYTFPVRSLLWLVTGCLHPYVVPFTRLHSHTRTVGSTPGSSVWFLALPHCHSSTLHASSVTVQFPFGCYTLLLPRFRFVTRVRYRTHTHLALYAHIRLVTFTAHGYCGGYPGYIAFTRTLRLPTVVTAFTQRLRSVPIRFVHAFVYVAALRAVGCWLCGCWLVTLRGWLPRGWLRCMVCTRYILGVAIGAVTHMQTVGLRLALARLLRVLCQQLVYALRLPVPAGCRTHTTHTLTVPLPDPWFALYTPFCAHADHTPIPGCALTLHTRPRGISRCRLRCLYRTGYGSLPAAHNRYAVYALCAHLHFGFLFRFGLGYHGWLRYIAGLYTLRSERHTDYILPQFSSRLLVGLPRTHTSGSGWVHATCVTTPPRLLPLIHDVLGAHTTASREKCYLRFMLDYAVPPFCYRTQAFYLTGWVY